MAITKVLGIDGCGIITSIDIRPKNGNVFFIFTDGREVSSDQLSDGYRRLINIVTDLAFRCAILNKGIFGADVCTKTIGTVLIDEIDLHLHPFLQTKTLSSFSNCFPLVQFIGLKLKSRWSVKFFHNFTHRF